MNTYQVQCIAIPRPIERVKAPHSFAARRDYAARHGVELLDCYAKRVWNDGTIEPTVLDGRHRAVTRC